ncbi:hypothetical protein [Aneurinibacillus terranovensis]|uniref:hypothetical protein n=1 Tax=Aneurinibacillus terranovensis TaxID=278991 RepID=UPI0004031E0A|nr:hypothetical protein [Aneurinibacillus terranovensis]
MSNAKYTIQSKLMNSYDSGKPVNFEKDMAAAQDEQGQVMFFSIGTDDCIYYFSKANASATGWESVNISDGMVARSKAVLLATAQDEQGKPILAAVFQSGVSPNDYEVYFTKDFSPGAKENRWVFRGKQSGVEITNITTGYGKNGQVMIVITTQAGVKTANYLINPNINDSTWLWREVPAPMNSARVLHTAVGHHAKLQKVAGIDALLYELYQINDTETALVVTSLPDFHFYNHQIPLDFNPTTFGLVDNKNGNSELIVGDSTLYYLDTAVQLSKDADQVKNGKVQINATPLPHPVNMIQPGIMADNRLECWFLSQDGYLYRSLNQSGSTSWVEPLAFQANVGKIATHRNTENNLNDIFTADLDNNLLHYHQDLQTTRWLSHSITVKSLDSLLSVNAYHTQIRITDEYGYPVAGSKMKLTSSELTQVTINNKTYYVDQKQDAIEMETDTLGNVTIIHQVTSLASPTFTVEGEAFPQPVPINPLTDIQNKLSTMSEDDFINARLQTDDATITKPLFQGRSKDDLKGAHQSIQQLISMGNQLPSKNNQNSGTPQTNTTPLATKFSIDFNGKTPAYTEHADSSILMSASQPDFSFSSAFDGITYFFGDIWNSIKKGFIEVTGFIIEKVSEGIRIVINGIKEAFHVVISFAEQVWDVVEFIIQKIGVVFEDIVQWLGFIFNWKDILRSHNVMKTVISHSLDYSISKLESGKEFVHNVIGSIKEKVLGKDVKAQLGAAGSQKLVTDKASGFSLDKPEVSWVFSHVTSGSVFDNHTSVSSYGGAATLDNSLLGGLESLKEAAIHLGEEIYNDMNNMSAGEFISKIVAVLEEMALDAAEKLANGLIDLAKSIVGGMKGILTMRWNIPILTPLYENVIAPGSTLSLLDLLCLLTSIPATVAYKIATNRVPFSEQTADAITSTANYDELIQALSRHESKPFRAMSLLHATAAAEADLPGEQKDTNQEEDMPSVARGFSYFFGFTGTIGSLVYSAANGFMVATDSVKVNRMLGFGIVKFVSGLVSNISNLITMAISLGYEKKYVARYSFEMAVTVYQFAFSIKDGLVMWNQIQRFRGVSPDDILDANNILSDMMDTVYDLGETVLGFINAGLFIALIIWEGVDGTYNRVSNVLKIPQNLGIAATQIMSVFSHVSEDPRFKVIYGAILGVIGVGAGLITGTRVVMNIVDEEAHMNI